MNTQDDELLEKMYLAWAAGEGTCNESMAAALAVVRAHNAATARPRMPDDMLMMETMDARDLQCYDYGCMGANAAIQAVLDGQDKGEGTGYEPWQSIRKRLVALVAATAPKVAEVSGLQLVHKSLCHSDEGAIQALLQLENGRISIVEAWRQVIEHFAALSATSPAPAEQAEPADPLGEQRVIRDETSLIPERRQVGLCPTFNWAEAKFTGEVVVGVGGPGGSGNVESAEPARTDGRCQYAIDHSAEDLGHCPVGKCAMPAANVQEDTLVQAAEQAKLSDEQIKDLVRRTTGHPAGDSLIGAQIVLFTRKVVRALRKPEGDGA